MRKRIKGTERTISFWSGGSSSQICIWPETAQYAERNFLYRISTAVADTEEWSAYTALPGVTRHLLMLEGSALVKHQGQYELLMQPYEAIDVFDGGWESSAKGKVRDFNLMCREQCEGRMQVLSGHGQVPVENADHRLLFCAEGEADVVFHDETIHLCKEDALLLIPAESCEMKQDSGAKIVVCDMKL